jgi:hypothetical protein
MQKDNDNIERLQTLEHHAQRTEVRLNSVEKTLNTHSGKLDRIVDAVTQHTAKPQFNPREMVSFIRDVVVLGAAAGSVIIYIATNIAAGPAAILDLRVTQIERRLDAGDTRVTVATRTPGVR